MRARYILLASLAAGFITSCGESKQPAPTVPVPAVAPASPAVESAPPAAAAAPPREKNLAARNLDPEKIKRGESVYRANCASCHGPNGEATPGWRTVGADGRYPPPPLDDSAHAWHHSTETLEKMIREGSPGGIGAMPGWEGKLTNQQIDDVIIWIKSLWSDEIYEVWDKEIEHKPQAPKS